MTEAPQSEPEENSEEGEDAPITTGWGAEPITTGYEYLEAPPAATEPPPPPATPTAPPAGPAYPPTPPLPPHPSAIKYPYGPGGGQPPPGTPQGHYYPPPPPAGPYGEARYGTGQSYPVKPNELHELALPAFILALLSVMCCGVLSPIALGLGIKAYMDVQASPEQYGQSQSLIVATLVISSIGMLILLFSTGSFLL